MPPMQNSDSGYVLWAETELIKVELENGKCSFWIICKYKRLESNSSSFLKPS